MHFYLNKLLLMQIYYSTTTVGLNWAHTIPKGSLTKNRKRFVKTWLLTGEASQCFNRSLN